MKKNDTFAKWKQDTTAQKTRVFVSWVANIFFVFSPFSSSWHIILRKRGSKKGFFARLFFSFEVYSLTYMFPTMYYLYEPSFFREKNMLDLTRRGKSFGGRKKRGF